MGLDPKAAGQKTRPIAHSYRWQDVALYALGIGTPADDLDFLYEARGPKVHPTYAVVPAYEGCRQLFDVVAGDLSGVVHGSQKIALHRPFAPSGTLTTIGIVEGVYDLKRMAQSTIRTETRDESGALVCETEWVIMYLKDGGFGGEAPPRTPKYRPPDRDPDWAVVAKTSPEQAHVYRLGGHDYNPLHVDPEAAMQAEKVTGGRPILHGLCTYGYIARAILAQECGGEPSRLRTFYGRFSKPIWPGETIVTKGWRTDDRLIVQASTLERPEEPIFTNAYAELETP
ncbi:MAG: MaoC family dehydratase N-terminal domain-containing protein [Sandaracinaceae bacterium]|nr:MaoC family dehydratase N-terminal domain-containing protein [Sandaracinaceae bacterium]